MGQSLGKPHYFAILSLLCLFYDNLWPELCEQTEQDLLGTGIKESPSELQPLAHSKMVHYKLSYFNLRGMAEPSRQILAYAGEVFDDNRVEREQWPALKSSMPFGTMPVLHVDGKPLAQSHAIARYLARQFGLNGTNSWEEAQVNSLADLVKDYQQETRAFFAVKMGFAEGDADKLYKDVFLPAFRKHYAFLTNFLKASGSGYLVGNGVTWIDLVVAQHTSDVLATKNSLLVGSAHLMDEFPELKEHQKRIHAIPRIQKWLQIRPVTPF